ncbi:MAG: hypothetical protein LBH39_00260, partial [Clostridiales Family XIII bacterium]|nr:hypothetical protein [Clostridiales Family XIII bacterium]
MSGEGSGRGTRRGAKRGIRHVRYFFFLLCAIVGFSIVAQARSTDGMNLFVSRKTISDIQVSIESEEAGIQDIYKRMEEAELKLQEYEEI